MNTNQHDRHVEILAEEIVSQESTYTDIDDIKNDLLNDAQFELYPATVISAIQRAVEEALKEKEADQCKGVEKSGISNVTFVVRAPDYTQQLEAKVNELEAKLKSIEINNNQLPDTNPYSPTANWIKP